VLHVSSLEEQKKLLMEKINILSWERNRIGSWGSFNPEDINFLEKNKVVFYLYELTPQDLEDIPADIPYIITGREKTLVCVVALGMEIPGKTPFAVGENSLAELEEFLVDTQDQLAEINKRLVSLVTRRHVIEAEMQTLLTQIEFETARTGMELLDEAPAEYTVSWITGFVPSEDLERLKSAATENSWALIADDPSLDDLPPTKLRSSPLVRIIHPVLSFLGTVPGYREFDISPSYLIFFSLFFAMILGDAGYGALLFFVALIVGISLKRKNGVMPDAVKLFMLLTFSAIVWGAINGAWFQIPHEHLPVFLSALIIPPFNNAGPVTEFPAFLQNIFRLPAEVPTGELKTRWNIQFLCFSIAIVQLVWARGKRIKSLLPSLSALAQLGTLVMMLGLYFLVLNMLLGIEFPPFAMWFIAIGIVFNLVFSEQNGGNFFVNVGKGFGNFIQIFLKAVSCFADIISYIRLFAVGLAAAMIAQIFNDIAVPADGLGSFGVAFLLRLIPVVIILVAGHGLNLALTALSVIVHGVRLNLLEYAGNHLEMEWSGYSYNPFALKQKKKETS
ncbi:MAG: V-type ATP synthase subunit I, partial [Treponema sp.]|nr:V-type ATP synthase subunit I [Treponema sp.]